MQIVEYNYDDIDQHESIFNSNTVEVAGARELRLLCGIDRSTMSHHDHGVIKAPGALPLVSGEAPAIPWRW